MDSPKYNRTYHVPWSPGGTSDDKIAKSVDSLLNTEIIITEKVDGSNASLERDGCFSRSHAGAPTHASFDGLKALHAGLPFKVLSSLQIFGEWCYALHSIAYDKLPGYFLVFNVRTVKQYDQSIWFSWQAVAESAEDYGLPTVPVLFKGIVKTETELRELTEKLAAEPSTLGTIREGVVIRVARAFEDQEFDKCVMKWVRANHVQTSEHWKDQKITKNKLKA